MPLSVRGEQRAAVALAAAAAVYALKSRREVERRRKEDAARGPGKDCAQRLPSAGRPQDHPLASWGLGNAIVLASVGLKQALVGNLNAADSNVKNFLKLWAGSVVSVEAEMVGAYILVNGLYAHTPFFSDKRPKQTTWEVMLDYLQCNTVVNVVTGVIQLALFRLAKNAEPAGGAKEGFRPLRFLFRLAWVRAWVDSVFWLGHYVLHTKSVYWAHKRHHEHNKTKLTTNYHFAWYDLMVEAFLPLFSGIASHELLIGPIAEPEANLIAGYIFFHEIMSHAGKPMPTMNVLPPLAPFLQRWDDQNTWAHEIHHRTLKANYSISFYFDRLVGTDRWY